MLFRLQLLVSGIFLQGNSDGSLTVVVNKPRKTKVSIDRGEIHDLPATDGRTVATATCDIQPRPRVLEGFRALSEGKVPVDTPPESLENLRRFQMSDGTLRTDILLPASSLPQGLASFVTQVSGELYSAIRQACGLLRWRHSLDGPHNPFRSRAQGAEWSFNGVKWFLLPGDTGLRFSAVPSVYPTASVRQGLQALLDQGREEPIAHQLFREATDNSGVNRRSALVIGVAALEVGLKDFLSDLVRPAEWLVMNLPAPPVKRIIAEYIPTIPTRLQIDGRVLIPPTALGLIDKAVLLRNRVAHATGEDVNYDLLDDMLAAIRDTLWLFDYYAGNSWALSHLSESCRRELGLAGESETAKQRWPLPGP